MKTIKHRRSLNDFFIADSMNANDLYSALYLEDLDKIRVHDDIIDESVLRDDVLQELFDYSTSNRRTLMTVKEVMNHLPIGSKQYKTLKKSSSNEHRLYVDICDFSGTDFFEELKYFSKNELPNNVLIAKSVELTNKLNRYTEGGFITFDNHREFGILFLNAKTGVNMFTFKHEIIHYFNWVKGAFKTSTSAEESFYENEVKAIHNSINPNFYVDNLTYVTSSNEYESLLNNFLDLLKDIKRKYFNEMTRYDFAKMIVNVIEYRRSKLSGDEGWDEYFNRLKSQQFFKDLKKQSSFSMIVFFNLINYKVTNIKNHIFGVFS